MNRIDRQEPRPARSGQNDGRSSADPWKPRASEEVRRLRSVITNRSDEQRVSDEMAPMMAEFLSRLDKLSERAPQLHQPPPTPGGGAPRSPAELAEDLRGAVQRIEQSEFGARMREDGPVAQMMSEARDFLRLRRACIARASNAAQ